jgi:protease I
MKKVLMVVAPVDFRDEECMEPKKVFEEKGFQVTIASNLNPGDEAKGMLGGRIIVDINIKDIKTDQYDAIVFVGGSGSTVYFNNKVALKIAKDAYEKGKIIGAICIAPSILANAGVLKGKRATSYPSERQNLTKKGAMYIEEPVVVDGNVVTANGPKSATSFGKEITKLIEKKQE